MSESRPSILKSNWFKVILFLLSLLSSSLVYKYLTLNEIDRLLLFTKEANTKWADYIERFRNQTSNYRDCDPDRSGQGCACFKPQIDLDLANWIDVKLDAQLLSTSKSFGVHYQIIDNKLYRQKSCLFQPRCQGVEYFLLKALKQTKFKNIDLLINVHDWPQVHHNYKRKLFPVLSFSKDVDLFKGELFVGNKRSKQLILFSFLELLQLLNLLNLLFVYRYNISSVGVSFRWSCDQLTSDRYR